LEMAAKRLIGETAQLWGAAHVNVHKATRTSADKGRTPSR
jgi:hypothetical protein